MITKVLAGGLSKFLEIHILTEGQGEFGPERGCADLVLVLRSDIMRSHERWTFLAFLNVSKAYDTVRIEGL